MMKNNQEIEVSFGGLNESPGEVTSVKEDSLEPAVTKQNEVSQVVGETVEEQEEEHDAYAEAVDRLFEQYQVFQEGMQGLPKLAAKPALMQMTLDKLLKTFKEEVKHFRKGNYQVEEMYEEGHGFILQALDKYDEFLTEYPKALAGKGGLKAMKKIKDLGALSGRADQDMKAAFRSFDQAVNGGGKG